jgi:hypothetical protein
MAVARVVQFLREQAVRAELETVADAQLLQWFRAKRDESAMLLPEAVGSCSARRRPTDSVRFLQTKPENSPRFPQIRS